MEGYMRLLGYRQDKKEKIIRVALVSTIVDSYETVISPDGCLSPLESVPVDYNHNRISTGAYLTDAGFENIKVPNGKGGEMEVRARVVEVHVPMTARMWEKSNKDRKAEEVQSLYESVENGRIGWASVDFAPVKSAIERVYNATGELVREVYTQYRLNFLSLLDTKPGQDTSYFLDIRSIKFNKRIMMTEIIAAITAQLGEVEVTNLEIMPETDTNGVLEFNVGETEYSATYTYEGDALTLVIAEPETPETLEDLEEVFGPSETPEAPEEERAEWDTAYINDLPNEAFVIVEPAYLNGEVENKEARHLPYKDMEGNVDLAHLRNALARVDQIEAVTDSITTEELRAQATSILADLKAEYLDDREEMPKADDAMDARIAKLEATIAELTNKLSQPSEKELELETRIAELNTTYERILRSPEMPKAKIDAATDEVGEGAKKPMSDSELAEKLARQQIRSNY